MLHSGVLADYLHNMHPPDPGVDRFNWVGLGFDPKEPFFSDLVRLPL